MNIDSIISITLSREAQAPSARGFGTIGLLAYQGPWAPGEYQRLYAANASGLAQMVSDGFATTDPAYYMAQALVAQNPHPPEMRILRRLTPFRQHLHIEPDVGGVVPPAGTDIVVAIELAGVTRTYTRTSAGVSKNAEAMAIAALINADAAGWGTAGSTQFVCSVTGAGAGDYIEIQAVNALPVPGPGGLGLLWYVPVCTSALYRDVTPDPGLAADFALIRTLGTTDYYGVVMDSAGAGELVGLATVVETQVAIAGYATRDSRAITATGEPLSTLAAANREHTWGIAHQGDLREYPAVALMARGLAVEPGLATWAFTVRLSGVTASALTDNQVAEAQGHNGNTYTDIAGWDSIFPGAMASGEFIDIVTLGHWVTVRVQEEIIRILATRPKIPYTDKGVSDIKAACFSVVRRQMADDDSRGLLKGSELFTAPKVADVSAVDKTNRYLPDCTLSAEFVGAVHTVGLGINLRY